LLLYSLVTSVCVTAMVSLAIAIASLGEIRKQDSEADKWLLENGEIRERQRSSLVLDWLNCI
jgi:hypothetical protein